MTLRLRSRSDILSLSSTKVVVHVCSTNGIKRGGLSEKIFKELSLETQDRWDYTGQAGETEIFNGIRGPYIVNLYERENDNQPFNHRKKWFEQGLRKILEYYPNEMINIPYHISDGLAEKDKKAYIQIIRQLCIRYDRCIVLHRL